jgi:hypothetical protein
LVVEPDLGEIQEGGKGGIGPGRYRSLGMRVGCRTRVVGSRPPAKSP